VIGGAAAGPKTAATLARRRPDWRITLFEKGERVSFATCGLPWLAAGEIPSPDALVRTSWGAERSPEFFRDYKGFTAVTKAEVIALDRARRTVTVRRTATGETFAHGYDKLVLATGATPRTPPFPCCRSERVRHFTRPQDAIAFRRLAEQGKIGEAVIIGAGLVGCELAEAAAGLWGIRTRVIERERHALPYALDEDMAVHVAGELARNGVLLVTGATVRRVVEDDDRLAVEFLSGEDGTDARTCTGDFVFLCIGVQPETTLARTAGLAIGASGGLRVNEFLQTSDPHIYAAGDCIESTHLISRRPLSLPMGSLANRHGRVIAEHMTGGEARLAGVAGGTAVKVFGLNVASVGLTERAAAEAGFAARAVTGSFSDRPDYHPEHESVIAKLVYDPADRRLLGLQAVGAGEVVRRIDVFSSFLQRGAIVEDLLDFEHAYSPPYAEALDPLHHLAAMAQAQERGVEFVGAVRALAEAPPDALWLDVRERGETAERPLAVPGAPRRLLNLPLGELRAQLDSLDRRRDTYVVCRRGARAYQAALLLRSHGFERVHVVGGGMAALEASISDGPDRDGN